MARHPRSDTVTKEGGVFHVFNRACGFPGNLPFRLPGVARYFVNKMLSVLSYYCLQIAAFTIMGNHYHLIVKVPKYRRLSRRQLHQYAYRRWGLLWRLHTRSWNDERWHQFNRDLFRLDCFMRDLQSPFARWFNDLTGRQGHFFGGRFEALKLDSLEDLQECLFYIELNPVRVHLTKLPEKWRYGSARLRHRRKDQWLIPLAQLFADVPPEQVWTLYRAGLLYRGAHPDKDNQAAIPEWLLQREEQRGFPRGIYLKPRKWFTRGLLLASAEVVRDQIARLVKKGRYRRRRHPIAHLDGLFYTVREQRSTARS